MIEKSMIGREDSAYRFEGPIGMWATRKASSLRLSVREHWFVDLSKAIKLDPARS